MKRTIVAAFLVTFVVGGQGASAADLELQAEGIIFIEPGSPPSCEDHGVNAAQGYEALIQESSGTPPPEPEKQMVSNAVIEECRRWSWELVDGAMRLVQEKTNGTSNETAVRDTLDETSNQTVVGDTLDETSELLGDGGSEGIEAGCVLTRPEDSRLYEYCVIWCSWYPRFGELTVEVEAPGSAVMALGSCWSNLGPWVGSSGIMCMEEDSCRAYTDSAFKSLWGYCHFLAQGHEAKFSSTTCKD